MIWNVLEPQDSVTSNSFRCCIDTLHLLSSYNCLCQRMRWSSLGWLRYSQGFVTRHIQDLIPWHIYNYLPSALNDFAYDGADFAVNRKTAHRAKSVQQAEQHQFQMSFFIEPKESSCATQACQRSLAFFPDSFFLNKFSSQAIAERASVPLTARVILVDRSSRFCSAWNGWSCNEANLLSWRNWGLWFCMFPVLGVCFLQRARITSVPPIFKKILSQNFVVYFSCARHCKEVYRLCGVPRGPSSSYLMLPLIRATVWCFLTSSHLFIFMAKCCHRWLQRQVDEWIFWVIDILKFIFRPGNDRVDEIVVIIIIFWSIFIFKNVLKINFLF
jgi:hypothetical protein